MKFKILLMAILVTVFFSCSQDNNQVNDGQEALKVEVLKAPNGEITGAWYKANDGSIIKMKIVKNSLTDGYNTEMSYYKNDKKILALEAGVMDNFKGIGIVYTSAIGIDVNYRAEMDATSINIDDKSSIGNAPVNVLMNGKTWNNSFDFRTSLFSKTDTPNLNESIPYETSLIIAPFDSVLENMSNYYADITGFNVNDIVPGQPLLEDKNGELCRLACWAVFDTLAGICCISTQGWGCPACIALAGANASLCSDSCPN